MMVDVLETPDGKWGLYVDGILIGDSKLQCDAVFAKRTLERAIDPNSSKFVQTEL